MVDLDNLFQLQSSSAADHPINSQTFMDMGEAERFLRRYINDREVMRALRRYLLSFGDVCQLSKPAVLRRIAAHLASGRLILTPRSSSIPLGTPLHAPPVVEEPIVEGEKAKKENWIFVEHKRRDPGDLDPETRKPTEFHPVLSSARVYEKGGGLLAEVKLTADGKPVKVPVPVGIQSFEVVFDDDFGGQFEIAHQPYENPFTDETEPPTPDQLARLNKIRLV